MTYTITPNANQAPLNQPLIQFLTQNVQDPVVQQNFELLNRLFQAQNGGVPTAKANLVFGSAYGSRTPQQYMGTNRQTPGPFQVQITTQGNPVQVKLQGFFFQLGSPSFITLQGSAVNIAQSKVGWLRTTQGSTNAQIIAYQEFGLDAQVDSTDSLVAIQPTLPAFAAEDVVPSGTYTYQFFFKLINSSQTISFQNVLAMAYEMR